MAENVEMIRPINLPEAQQLSENDVFILDSETGGVRKIPKNKVYTPVDDTLSESGEAADAKVTGEKIDELKTETALIQNPVGNNSGELVSFSDGADMPAISVIAHIEPIQEGEGDPSPDNVRAISGWESVSVTDVGKNLINVADQTITSQRTIASNITLESGTYTVSANVKNNTAIVGYFRLVRSGSTIAEIQIPSNANERRTVTLTLSEPTTFNIVCNGASSGYNYAVSDIMIEVGNTATTYESYNGTTTTTPLGRTVYGGTLDVVTGVLTVDKGVVIANGSENWALRSSGTATTVFQLANATTLAPTQTGEICSHFEFNAQAHVASESRANTFAQGTSKTLFFQVANSIATTVSEFNAWLAQNPVTVVFDIATPQTYTLTAEEIRTLRGNNNVWCDSGIVDVTYRKDINIVIDELTNAIVSLGSNV